MPDIVFPLNTAILTAIGGLIYFLVDRIVPVIPESDRQNGVLRLISILLGAIMGILAVPLIPETHWTYSILVGAVIQGGGVGAAVTLGVAAKNAFMADPKPVVPPVQATAPVVKTDPPAA